MQVDRKSASILYNTSLQCRRLGFDHWVRKIPWRRKWQPTPVFLPEKFHGEGSPEGYSSWDHRIRHNWVTNAHQSSWHFKKTPSNVVASLVAQLVKIACNTGHLGSICGLGRSPGEGNGNLLQYSCLENPMDRGAW